MAVPCAIMANNRPSMRYLLFFATLVLVVTFLGGCSGSNSGNAPTPTPTPEQDAATRTARLEREFQGVRLRKATDEERTEARRAVLDFVKANLPGWNVKGMSSQIYEEKVFSIDADLEKQGRHVVVTFDTRMFFPESGDPYWLALPVNKFRQDRLHKLNDADLLEQLDKAQREIIDLENP